MLASDCQRFFKAILNGMLCAGVFCAPALADTAHRIALDARSRQVGLGVSNIPLIEREKGPGTQVVVDALLRKFAQSGHGITTHGPYQVIDQDGSVRVTGNGWYFEVYEDGTRVRYRNYSHIDRPGYQTVPFSEKFSEEKLETLGRKFIERHLSPFISLGSGETLELFKVGYQTVGEQAADGNSQPREAVVAHSAIFTRTVNGIDVVGAGSKAMVMFANDGTPFGFELDWPRYSQTGERQQVSPLSEVWDREIELDLGNSAFGERSLERFECGYYDSGVRQREGGYLVQAACYFHYMVSFQAEPDPQPGSPANSIRYGYARPIPAGAEVKPDCMWDEARLLTAGDFCP